MPDPSASAPIYSFAAPLFPDQVQLLLNLSDGTAVLLSVGEGEAVMLRSQRLTVSGAHVFLALLRAYPQYCPFKTLFASLNLPQPEEASGFNRTVEAVRDAPDRPGLEFVFIAHRADL